VRHDQLALLVQWQGAAVVRQWMNYHRRVLARLDHLVEITNGADARCRGKRAVLPFGAFLVEQEAPHQVGGGHVFVTGNRDQRATEFPGHVLDKAGFAAARRAFEHHRHTRAVSRLIELDFIRDGFVEGFLFDLVLLTIHSRHISLHSPNLASARLQMNHLASSSVSTSPFHPAALARAMASS
jgi:hypothetical protein